MSRPRFVKSIPIEATSLLRLAMPVALATGCGGGNTGSTSDGTEGNGDATQGGADDTGGEIVFPGDRVECCWVVTYGAVLPCNGATCYSFAEEACLTPGFGTPCVDRDTADINGNGTIDLEELQVACGQVCLDQGYDGTQPVGTTPLVPTDGTWDDPGGFVWSCSAIGTINSSVVDEQACTPPMFAEALPLEAPTHIATLAATDSHGALQISVLGTSLGPSVDGQANVGLLDCENGGIDGGVCTMQIEGLSLTLAESLTVGEYTIPSAQAILAGSAQAEVRFAGCAEGVCTGYFRFSEDQGNPLGVGLAWMERHEPTQGITRQFASVSNGSAGFGGISVVDGVLTIEAASDVGTLVLQGSGRDAFSDGVFASALFHVEMPLVPYAD